MAYSALKKITAEAKRLRKQHPSWEWKDCIKAASGKYNRGSLGGSLPMIPNSTIGRAKGKGRKSKGRKRKVSGVKPAKVGAVKPAGATLGRVSAGSLRSELKRRINSDIDKAVVRKFRATGKRIKRKIQKTITEKKAQLRRLL